MKFAKFFSVLVFISVLGYGAIGFYFLPVATFQGELTRMGMLPESMFGWTKPQPVIDPELMLQSSWQEADVLVIGDSFSDGRIWQTMLIKRGLRVRTESWDSVRYVCEDFVSWLREQGFTGRYVVFEIVERHVVNALDRMMACKKMSFHPNIYANIPRSVPITSFDPNRGDYSGRLSIGVQTQMGAWGYDRWGRSANFVRRELPNSIELARIKNGCTLFSHQRCDDALFLMEDFGEKDLPSNAIDNLRKINDRLFGITPIWVFVPDKTTAYLHPDKRFWGEVERQFSAPNLLRMTQDAIQDRVVDLYPANGSHFSTEGYLLMGDEIFKAIEKGKREQ